MPEKDLTHNAIKGMKAPDQSTEYYDTVESGLILRLSKVGTKTFAYRYRFAGKNRRFTIGKFPGVSLKQARNRVQELKVQVNNGIDPQAEKDRRKHQPDPQTFRELVKEFKEKYLPTLREKTRTEYKRIIDVELVPKLGKYPIGEITRNQIISLLDHKAYGNKKAKQKPAPTMANRIRARLSKIYSFAIGRGLAEVNPVTNIPKYKKTSQGKDTETRRTRYYTPEEIQELWEFFDNWEPPTGPVLKMLLITGQRKTETMMMKWEDIRGDVWTIPAEIAKGKRSHDVPLSDIALEVIESMRPLTGKSDYVFCSPKKDNEPIEWVKRAVKNIKDTSKVSDFRPHDLRRTMATYMAKLGVDRTTLGKILNHKGLAGDGQVTAIYDRHSYMKEKRQAMNRWSVYLQKIITGKTEAKIIKMS